METQKTLAEQTCVAFVQALASAAPTPGGGGAAALVGSVGVALGNMVGSLTIGKKRYANVQEEILSLMKKSDRLQEQLLAMVDQDAQVFAPLAQAYSLPAKTEQQRLEKERAMEPLLHHAAQVPLQIMELCMDALDVIKRFATIGSKSVMSDTGCAAACVRAALCAASLNVLINTKSMADRDHANYLNIQVEQMLDQGTNQANAIFKLVKTYLR